MSAATSPRRHQHDRSIGIDLSASAVNTAAVELSWDGDRATIVEIWGDGRQKVEDDCLVRLLERTDAKIGVDCPFGWPREFVALVAGQTAAQHFPRDVSYATPDERSDLAYRATDKDVTAATERWDGARRFQAGVRPLSVSADRIAHVAFRFVGLRSRMTVNSSAPRDGSGALVEVYPAAALSQWGAPGFRGYKGVIGVGVREAIVQWLSSHDSATGVRFVNLEDHRAALVASDHVLDALLCALIARDCDLRGAQVPEVHRSAALSEGWIHLPEQRDHASIA